jgi:hypothetical protein
MNQTKRQEKLIRAGDQLSLAEHLLMNHPLTSGKLNILQTTLNYLNLQIKWSCAGPLARLLITIDTALIGSQTTDSLTGFIGPTFDKFLKGIALLMKTTLPANDRGKSDLLIKLNQLLIFGSIYLTTQLLGKWKQLFPQQDPAAAKKGGEIFRELALLFLFGSHVMLNLFKMIAKGIGLEEKNEHIMSHIGLFSLIIIILTVTEEENKKNEELLESLHRFMIPTLDSIEYAIQKAHSQRKMSEEIFFTANTHLQLVRLALDKNDKESLQQTIKNSFEAFQLPYQDLKNDLKLITTFCNQLNFSFKNIFNQSEIAITSMTQAA